MLFTARTMSAVATLAVAAGVGFLPACTGSVGGPSTPKPAALPTTQFHSPDGAPLPAVLNDFLNGVQRQLNRPLANDTAVAAGAVASLRCVHYAVPSTPDPLANLSSITAPGLSPADREVFRVALEMATPQSALCQSRPTPLPASPAPTTAPAATTRGPQSDALTCDLDAPVKVNARNQITNRACDYTDASGQHRSYDPWIDGQLLDAQRRQADQQEAARLQQAQQQAQQLTEQHRQQQEAEYQRQQQADDQRYQQELAQQQAQYAQQEQQRKQEEQAAQERLEQQERQYRRDYETKRDELNKQTTTNNSSGE